MRTPSLVRNLDFLFGCFDDRCFFSLAGKCTDADHMGMVYNRSELVKYGNRICVVTGYRGFFRTIKRHPIALECSLRKPELVIQLTCKAEISI